MLLGALLLFTSALFFVSAGEPDAAPDHRPQGGFLNFVRGGFDVYAADRRFRHFVVAQWLGGAAALALPFYVLQAQASPAQVALLLGAQTAGALLSNPLWGWYGDRGGKRELLEVVAALNAAAPIFTLIWIGSGERWSEIELPYFAWIFLLLGAIGNGNTIAQLGYLLEI